MAKLNVKGIISLWLDDKDWISSRAGKVPSISEASEELYFFSVLIPVSYAGIGFGLYGEVSFNAYQTASHGYRVYELFKGPEELWGAVGTLQWRIEDLLAGKRELDHSRFHRLGYEMNEYEFLIWHGQAQCYDSWDGWNYTLWDTSSQAPAIWLYSYNGKFYFEITPAYDPKKCKVPYKIFMRNYRPLVQKELTIEQLHRLVQQARKVAALIFENQKKFELEGLSPDDKT